MPLNADQLRRMRLGGTQALPAPGTQPASIKWADESKTLLEVVHEESDRYAIIWIVPVDEVTVVKKVDDSDPDNTSYTWLVGPEIATALDAAGSGGFRGVAFAREEAQTLLRLEHGVSAVNSVQIALSGRPIADRESDDDFEIHCPQC